jgi:hypothetical protein
LASDRGLAVRCRAQERSAASLGVGLLAVPITLLWIAGFMAWERCVLEVQARARFGRTTCCRPTRRSRRGDLAEERAEVVLEPVANHVGRKIGAAGGAPSRQELRGLGKHAHGIHEGPIVRVL